MTHRLVYTRRAIRDIEGLDTLARKRLRRYLEALAENPFQGSHKLTDSRLGTYRRRVGDYRIIFDIEGNTIIILRVGHRREIYR